ncbi:ribonucleotide-diphosphate reductase subunit beta [Streptomyces sp. NBC_00237]|uniref:ribonucleotide-diphosphate reductase subunit beta n=1 Tax=Streptomyces sp. NBC_00237 TaxID=2975687 RepID=UPI002253DF0A|nr:ribonucleotide-diphosphate reductase subunit beta [Streptomyces sp. NBC_00237]MCX5205040.1 ribonucleotide-diphosphate reductase subunit beta [Streptomyces sp. NBC_00237]
MRWSTLLFDDSDLDQLSLLGAEDLLRGASDTLERRFDARELYRRWERQQWAASDIDLERDRNHWDRVLSPRTKERLTYFIQSFLVGEYTGLDLITPILAGCPDEDSLVYLGTQAADESRHTVFVSRLSEELLGMSASTRDQLITSWSRLSPAHRAVHSTENAILRDLYRSPRDYATWLRAVAFFHLITEGVLALHGQRGLVRSLQRIPLLPGTRAGFTAMTRDESRHVSFGLHALRHGVREGFAEPIHEVIETGMPLAAVVGLAPGRTPDQTAATSRAAEEILHTVSVRMRQLDMDHDFTAHVLAKCRAAQDAVLRAPAAATA